MKCPKCGSEQPEGTKFCGVCGAEIPQTYQPEQTVSSGKKSALPIAKIAGLAAGVIVLIIIISAISGGGYKRPIDLMFKSLQTGKASYMLKAVPKFVVEDTFGGYDDLDYIDDMFDELQDDLQDEFGKNAKISYKITDKDKLDKDDLEDAAEYLSSAFKSAGKKLKIKAGYEIDMDITIKGSKSKDTEDTNFTVIKIGGKWYIHPRSLYSFGIY
jgi:hypothetical protein